MYLESFKKNPFLLEEVGRERKLLFTNKVIQGINGVNPGGIYTADKTAIQTPFILYQKRVGEAGTGTQVSSTGDVDKAIEAVKFGLRRLKARILDKNNLSKNAVKAYFPEGSKSISKLKHGEIKGFLENIQTKVDAQVALLGADMQTLIADLITQWDAAFDEQGKAMSQRTQASTDVNQALWVPVAEALYLFLLHVCDNSVGEPEEILNTYFEQSIINTHRSRTLIFNIPADGVIGIEHPFEADGFYYITKKGTANIRSFASTTDHTFDGDMQEITTNVRTKILYSNYHVNNLTNIYLVFQNLSSTEAVEVKIVF